MTAIHSLVFLAASTSSKKATSSSSSYTFILFLVVIGVAGYFLLLRPQQQKARKQREAQSDIGVGDEVLTVGGVVGTVLDINSERVTIVTGAEDTGYGDHATPTRMVLVRNAIARKIEPTTPQPAHEEAEGEEYGYDEDDYAHEDDEHHEDDHDEKYPRYEYHPDEETAEENGQAPENRGVKRNGRRRRKTGSNGSDKADSETGEETGT